SFLNKADLGILASLSEGLPLALLEYGRAGLPVICTDVGECSEVIGQEGTIVPSKKPEVMSEAMINYLKHSDLLEKHSKNFQENVRCYYSEQVIIPQVLHMFGQ